MIRLSQAAAAAAAAVVAATGCATVDSGRACDRECLAGVADVYLAALAAGDPSLAPLATDVAFVENVTRMQPGEGLWASAAGEEPSYRIVVPDPVAAAVGVIAAVDRRTADGVAPALLAVRLKVEGGEITEAEHLVSDVPPEAEAANLAAPRPAMTTAVPEGERMARADIAEIAESYYEALVRSDGDLAPFAGDCERLENGMITAASYLPPATFASVDTQGRSPPPAARDCKGQMDSRRFAYIDSIDNRRVFAVDPVQGLAMSLSHFRQSMANGPHLMIAADGAELMWEEAREPYDLPAAHVFKITGGRIHEVEAIGIFVPYDSPSGWE